jgi:hypothetical protein
MRAFKHFVSPAANPAAMVGSSIALGVGAQAQGADRAPHPEGQTGVIRRVTIRPAADRDLDDPFDSIAPDSLEMAQRLLDADNA